MIRKSGYRFSEKIMLKQKDRAGLRFEEKSFRSRATFELARLSDPPMLAHMDRRRLSRNGALRRPALSNMRRHDADQRSRAGLHRSPRRRHRTCGSISRLADAARWRRSR